MKKPPRTPFRPVSKRPPLSEIKRSLPNALSGVRLVVTAPLLVAAMAAGSRPWFLGLLCVAWLTDALDGFLARRLDAVSDRGRMLDSWGDYVTAVLCVAGVGWLWPEVLRREWPWFAAAILSFFAIVAYGLLRYGRAPAYHTWLAKAVAVALPFVLGALLAGWSAWPLRGLVILQLIAAIDEAAIALLLPGISGEVPSAWHAWRRRERRGASESVSSRRAVALSRPR